MCGARNRKWGDERFTGCNSVTYNAIDVKSLKRGLGAECKNIWTGAGTACQDGSCSSLKDDAADTATQAGSGQGSGPGREMEESHTTESRLEATRQLEKADTEGVFRWIAQHMVENMSGGILQAVAGREITGAQIRQAISTQSTEEDCDALHALFEYGVSTREMQALHAQLQEFRSLDGGEQTQATEGRRTRG